MELGSFTDKIASGIDLSEAEAVECFRVLQCETDEQSVALLLTAWARKGASSDEIFAIAQELRNRCKPVKSDHQVFIDVVGTGGSKIKTFNVSTASAFVIAGAGLPVAKHGNQAASSTSGSADVLRELGVDVEGSSKIAERSLNEIGICFMFAPLFHSLSPVVGKVRRTLGFPTIFNALGPLCNPANAPYQLIGSSDLEVQQRMASALSRLGTLKSWIVNSNGLDEFSVSVPTMVVEVCADISGFEIAPEDFGIEQIPINGLQRVSPSESARLISAILASEEVSPAALGLVLINSAAALYIAGIGLTMPESLECAKESICSGKALNKLNELRKYSSR